MKVAEEVRSGLSPICATCEHFWTAKDKEAPDCGHGATCGGPIKGRMFPDYKGQLPREHMARICFMSGDKATHGVKVVGVPGMVGITRRLIPTLAQLLAKRGDPSHKVILVNGKGEACLALNFLPEQDKTLSALLTELNSPEGDAG